MDATLLDAEAEAAVLRVYRQVFAVLADIELVPLHCTPVALGRGLNLTAKPANPTDCIEC